MANYLNVCVLCVKGRLELTEVRYIEYMYMNHINNAWGIY